MNRVSRSITAVSFLAMASIAQEPAEMDIHVSGTVTDTYGKALPGAAVNLEKAKLSAMTDANGAFSIIQGAAGIFDKAWQSPAILAASVHNGFLFIRTPEKSLVAITAYSLKGTILSRARKNLDAGIHRIAVPSGNRDVYLYRVESGSSELTLKGISTGKSRSGTSGPVESTIAPSALAKQSRAAAFADLLSVTKAGYADFSMNIENPQLSGISIQLTPAPAGGLMLPQEGNPVHATFDIYKEFTDKADNILSYQLDNGGWPKNVSYDGKGNGGSGLGTFDNGATTMELTVMADAYKRTGDSRYLESARKAMDYTLEAQYPEGGWPQFYPLRGGYSDHVTFNDDAMSRVLAVLQHAADRTPPFDTDVFTEEQRAGFQKAIDGGVDYILKAQIVQNGKKAAWCAQHGKSDYEPKRARAYEHPSLSGLESVGIIGFLMTQPQTPEIKEAVLAAIDWYRSPDTYLADYAYSGNRFVPQEGSRVWYRFYDIPTNEPIFSNYDGKIHIGLEHQDKKKGGYRWGGDWGETIIAYAEKVGY